MAQMVTLSTPDALHALECLYHAGVPHQEIARLFGQSTNHIRNIISSAGMAERRKQQQAQVIEWATREIERLAKLERGHQATRILQAISELDMPTAREIAMAAELPQHSCLTRLRELHESGRVRRVGPVMHFRYQVSEEAHG